MSVSLTNRHRVVIILIVCLATISFHYGWIIKPSHESNGLFHAIHGRLCYIPIILGAVWFSVWGGLAVSVLIILLTIPYMLAGGGGHSVSIAGESTEFVFYLAIGLTAGILIELQRRERARREALARELTRSEHLKSLGQMAAGLAHEIKNPLGSIQGSAEILADDFPQGSRKHELLNVLTRETQRLNGVVEDFLNFARPRPLKRVPTNVNALLAETIAQIEIDSRAANIRIERDFDAGVPEGPFDPEKLRQVFINLALNAVGAMPDGGRLRIHTRLAAMEGRRAVMVRFADEGGGIAPENRDKIFDPFFTTSDTGSGLGLSISHMIVQHHGGRIDVEPNGEKGTTFTVTLPLGEPREPGP